MDLEFLYILIFLLTVIQTIAGIGILVLGTPLLLILDVNFIKILGFLLPISVFTSLLNILFFIFLEGSKFKINKNTKKIFFFITLPAVFLGLYLLKNFQEFINFKYFVSIIILISLILVFFKNFLIKIENKFKFMMLSFTGVIHGLSNSGGSLLSLLFSLISNKNQSRYNITYFYFFLAFFQYVLFIYLFGKNNFNHEFLIYILISIPGCLVGNYLIKYLNKKIFEFIIYFLALIGSISLIYS